MRGELAINIPNIPIIVKQINNQLLLTIPAVPNITELL